MATSIVEIVRGWSVAERKQALAEIVGDLVRDSNEPIVVENVGLIWPQNGEPCAVQFDDSTPWLREMRRRAETPEDSELLMELEVPEDQVS